MPVAYSKQSLSPFDQAVRFIEQHESTIENKVIIRDLDSYVRSTYGKYVKHEEGFKLLRDIIYYRAWENFPEFCSNLKIRSKGKGLIDFKFKKAQRIVWNNNILPYIQNDEPVRLYILKGRQIGFTTFIQALIYKSSALHCDIAGNIVAHNKTKASEIFNIYKLFLRTSPDTIKPTRRLSNRGEIFFSNPDEGGELGLESYIKVDTADNPHLGASSTLQLIHLSEFARYESINKQAEDALATLFQTVAYIPGTMIFLETTAYGEGLGKKFWDTDNGFQKIFIPWVCDENYRSKTKLDENKLEARQDSEYGDEIQARDLIINHLQTWNPDKDLEWCKDESLHRLAWRRITLKQNCLGKLPIFQREYPLSPEEAFISTSVSALDSVKLYAMKKMVEESKDSKPQFTYLRNDPNNVENNAGVFLEAVGGELIIYEERIPNEIYFIGVDVGAGVGGDNSVIQVVRSDYILVATYVNQIDPDDLAYPVYCLALYYNNAFITPEANAMGLATIGKLTKDLRYRNIYLRTRLGTKDQKPQRLYGFHTSFKTKPALISSLNSLIKSGTMFIRDLETINEGLHFVYDLTKNTVAAASGYKDDRVISLALAVFSIQDELPKIEDYRNNINLILPGTIEDLARQSDEYTYYSPESSFGSVLGVT